MENILDTNKGFEKIAEETKFSIPEIAEGVAYWASKGLDTKSAYEKVLCG